MNDFNTVKDWSKRTGFMHRTLSSVKGYFVAMVCKTLPKTGAAVTHTVHVKVTARDTDSLWVDHRRGDFVRKCCIDHKLSNNDHSSNNNEDEKNNNHDDIHNDSGKDKRKYVLYDGDTGFLAASTVPYYGGGLRAFPFARTTVDKMHLRVGRIRPVAGVFNLRAIFTGSYRDMTDNFSLLDFIGADFEVQVSPSAPPKNSKLEKESSKAGFPFQHSGDSAGNVVSFRLRVVDKPVRFLSLLKKRPTAYND